MYLSNLVSCFLFDIFTYLLLHITFLRYDSHLQMPFRMVVTTAFLLQVVKYSPLAIRRNTWTISTVWQPLQSQQTKECGWTSRRSSSSQATWAAHMISLSWEMEVVQRNTADLQEADHRPYTSLIRTNWFSTSKQITATFALDTSQLTQLSMVSAPPFRRLCFHPSLRCTIFVPCLHHFRPKCHMEN